MTPDLLLIALAECGITIAPEGEAIRFHAGAGGMPEPLAAALSQHKMIILVAFKTAGKRQYEEVWEIIRTWLVDGKPGPVPSAVIAAGKALGLPYGANEFPPAYEARLRMALRVRGLLLAFQEPEAPTAIAAEQIAAEVA